MSMWWLSVAGEGRDCVGAVVEVDASPVPATCLGREIRARPFVIEPRDAGDAAFPSVDSDCSGERKLRHAVVIACLLCERPFAAHTFFAVRQRRLRHPKFERQREVARRDACVIHIFVQRERPVFDMDVGCLFARLGKAESSARRTLIGQQTAAGRQRERRMREEQLAWREAAFP